MKSITTIIILLSAHLCLAQQIPQYSQYLNNRYMINPAATGSNDQLDISLGGRMQWVGIEDAPKTSYLYFSAPAHKWRQGFMKRTYGKVRRNNRQVKHPTMRIGKVIQAFGAQFVADQYGPFRRFRLAGSYAVHIPLTRDYNLSFGTNLGLSSRSFLPEKAQVLTSLTNTGVDNNYATYVSNQSGQYTMDLDVGLYFHGKGTFVGISANELTGDLVKFGNRIVNFDPQIHYLFTAGHKFSIGRNMKLTPAVLVKYMTPAPVSIEGTLLLDYHDFMWFGVSYRHTDAMVFMLGGTISDKFKIGYSYDLSISRLIGYNSGGHELVLGIMLGKTQGATAKY